MTLSLVGVSVVGQRVRVGGVGVGVGVGEGRAVGVGGRGVVAVGGVEQHLRLARGRGQQQRR